MTNDTFYELRSDLPGLQSKANYPLDKSYCPVPNSVLPQIYQKGIKEIQEAIGLEYDPKDYTIIVKTEAGCYIDSYLPTFFQGETEPILYWGEKIIPISQILESQKLSYALERTETGFYLTLSTDNFFICCKLFLSSLLDSSGAELRQFDIKKILKTDLGKLNTMMQKRGQSLIRIEAAAVGHYKVTKIFSRPGNWGTMYSLQVTPVQPDGDPETYLTDWVPCENSSEYTKFNPNETYIITSCSSLNNRLKALGDNVEKITPENPARLVISQITQNGKKTDGSTRYKVNAALITPPLYEETDEFEIFEWV